jgi:hypothetical protein
MKFLESKKFKITDHALYIVRNLIYLARQLLEIEFQLQTVLLEVKNR